MTRRLLGALAGLLLAGCAASEAEARPPVWIVRDADSELVLFGSIHVLPPGLDWRPAELDAALARADDLWFELPIDPASEARVGQLAAQHGVLPEGRSLSAMLSPAGRRRLETATADLGVSMAVLDRLEPWFAEVVLAGAQFQKAGADAGSGVEKMISGSAPAAAQRRAFESPEEQIAIFDAAPLPEQIASLEQSLIELNDNPRAYQELVAHWMAGDLKALDEDALEPLRAAAPGLYARLVTERNERWLKALKTRLDGSGRTVVVVGVGHLVGQDGLPARLRALGYSVEGP
ncbi:TraB/GumN family protein [Phenylobacterium sp.]|uniref:TraB/GumN family protein n=1 Tax=Phenylobacterium sp. TaxID=1871053 RepID=UPI0028A1FEFF|nr:TraB/GumN family protein [Phenylobacterium sp.]